MSVNQDLISSPDDKMFSLKSFILELCHSEVTVNDRLCGCAAPLENGNTEMTTEEPWDQKEAESNEEEPGGGSSRDRGPEVTATTEETAPEIMEEEEEVPVPKVQPVLPDAPKKEHINVVFIGHVGQCKHLYCCSVSG